MPSFYGTDKSNVSKVDISSDNAYTAMGKAFGDIANIYDEKEKKKSEDVLNKKKNKLLDQEIEENQFTIDKGYMKQEQKAIDDTYLNYVDSKMGEFDKEALESDNVGIPLNRVSKEARDKQYTIQQAYKSSLKESDKEAQDSINDEILRESLKYKTKDEFYKKVNPDLIKYADGKTMYDIDKNYANKDNQLSKINAAKKDLKNTAIISELKQKLSSEKTKASKKSKITASDEKLINKTIIEYFGGEFDSFTNSYVGLDKNLAKEIPKINARASQFRMSEDISTNEAILKALKEYEKNDKSNEYNDWKKSKDPLGLLKDKEK